MAKDQNNSGMTHNILTSSTKIIGTIETDSDIRIDGEIDGDVTCRGKVIVGNQGLINGNIFCSNAEIMGKVGGTLHVCEVLALKSTAIIDGDIKTKILSIEPNAYFRGRCEMVNNID